MPAFGSLLLVASAVILAVTPAASSTAKR